MLHLVIDCIDLTYMVIDRDSPPIIYYNISSCLTVNITQHVIQSIAIVQSVVYIECLPVYRYVCPVLLLTFDACYLHPHSMYLLLVE